MISGNEYADNGLLIDVPRFPPRPIMPNSAAYCLLVRLRFRFRLLYLHIHSLELWAFE